MKKIFVFLFIILTNNLLAQNQMLNTTRDQFNSNGLTIPTNGTVWGIASGNKGQVVGTIYLDTLWAKGNLKLASSIQPIGGKPVDTLSGLALRYNVFANEIEILLNTYKDVKAIQGDKIKSFSMEKEGKLIVFTNTNLFREADLPKGFLEVLVPGELTLASLHKTIVRKPTYTAAFDVGDKDTKILMDEDYYILQGGVAEKLKPSKKTILELMKEKASDVNAFVKVNDPDFKNRKDLIRVFELYNSLN